MTSKYGIEIPEGSHYTVYKLTGPDGKAYIGYTGKGVEKRWRNGNGYSRRTPIRRAIDAFGWDAFEKKDPLRQPDEGRGGKAKPVMCIETGKCYLSQCAAERDSGFYNVHNACSGRYKTCGGLHWRYLTEEEKERFLGSA